MSRIILFGFALLLLLGCSTTQTKVQMTDAGPSPEGYYTVQSKEFSLQYKVVDAHLLCILEGPSTGWLAMGIAPTTMMRGADFIIGYVEEDTGYIRDDYGIEFTEHAADKSIGGTDDVTLLEYDESDGKTSLVFSIPLASGDTFDKELVPGNTYKVIFAAGPVDDFDSYHNKKAVSSITLRTEGTLLH